MANTDVDTAKTRAAEARQKAEEAARWADQAETAKRDAGMASTKMDKESAANRAEQYRNQAWVSALEAGKAAQESTVASARAASNPDLKADDKAEALKDAASARQSSISADLAKKRAEDAATAARRIAETA